MKLTARQKKFISAFSGNATQAAIAAGYSAATAPQAGSRLLKNVQVAAAIAAKTSVQLGALEVKSEDVLRELLRIGLSDIGAAFDEEGVLLPVHKMPVGVRRAISAIETEELRVDGVAVGTIRKVKFWDKNVALANLGRNLKLFTDKVEHGGSLRVDPSVTLLERLTKLAEGK